MTTYTVKLQICIFWVSFHMFIFLTSCITHSCCCFCRSVRGLFTSITCCSSWCVVWVLVNLNDVFGMQDADTSFATYEIVLIATFSRTHVKNWIDFGITTILRILFTILYFASLIQNTFLLGLHIISEILTIWYNFTAFGGLKLLLKIIDAVIMALCHYHWCSLFSV